MIHRTRKTWRYSCNLLSLVRQTRLSSSSLRKIYARFFGGVIAIVMIAVADNQAADLFCPSEKGVKVQRTCHFRTIRALVCDSRPQSPRCHPWTQTKQLKSTPPFETTTAVNDIAFVILGHICGFQCSSTVSINTDMQNSALLSSCTGIYLLHNKEIAYANKTRRFCSSPLRPQSRAACKFLRLPTEQGTHTNALCVQKWRKE